MGGNVSRSVLFYIYRELFLIKEAPMSDKRNTWQKQVIYSVIKELKTHPTIQNLIDELEKRGYKIGIHSIPCHGRCGG